jgi:hypothetical protein
MAQDNAQNLINQQFPRRPRFPDPKSDVVFKKIFGQHLDLTGKTAAFRGQS